MSVAKNTKSAKSAAKTVKAAKTTKRAPKKAAAEKKSVAVELTETELRSLKALKAYRKPVDHATLAAKTGAAKGNRMRELTAKGLVSTTKQEGFRGHFFALTAKSRKLA